MKAVTIGGAMLDAIAIIESDRIERLVAKNAETSFLMLEEGRKVEASEISTHVGGGAINAAVAMARQGFDVSTIVKLGQDQRADIILTRLTEEGISTRWVVRDKRAPTGAAVLVSSHEKDAAIFTFRGANTLLACEDLIPDMFAVDLVYISGLSNEAADCFPQIVRLAKQNKATVATNPGIRQLTTRSSPFRDTLKDIDILSINRVEADALVPQLVSEFGEGGGPLEPATSTNAPTGTPIELIARGLCSGGFQMSLKAFVKALTSIGPGHVVITSGGSGAIVGTRDTILHCPVLSVDIAGTAGGGDAFASTFSSVITSGRTEEDAVKTATLNAASVMGHADTQTGLLSDESLSESLAQNGAALQITRWQL